MRDQKMFISSIPSSSSSCRRCATNSSSSTSTGSVVLRCLRIRSAYSTRFCCSSLSPPTISTLVVALPSCCFCSNSSALARLSSSNRVHFLITRSRSSIARFLRCSTAGIIVTTNSTSGRIQLEPSTCSTRLGSARRVVGAGRRPSSASSDSRPRNARRSIHQSYVHLRARPLSGA